MAIARVLIDKSQGYLLKAHLANSGLLWSAIVAVAGGARFFGPGVELLLPQMRALPAPAVLLNEREREVLRLVADGKTTKTIAGALCFSERTIKTVLHDIVTKLSVPNRSAAVARALREGYIV